MTNVAVAMLYIIVVANLQTSRCAAWPNFIVVPNRLSCETS